MSDYFSLAFIADLFSLPERSALKKIINKNDFITNEVGTKFFHYKNIDVLSSFSAEEVEYFKKIKPKKKYSCLELFAGSGGLALGMEKAGFEHVFLNEFNIHAANTLKKNRPNWLVSSEDVSKVSFEKFYRKVDVLSGGFPCQAFSYSGKGLGFADTRGTLFYHYARALKEINPKMFIAENVKGLLTHDKGKTLSVILKEFESHGYHVFSPNVFNCVFYGVPQKRERLIIIGVRKDLYNSEIILNNPPVNKKINTLKETFFAGELYKSDVPFSNNIKYSKKKEDILKLVPMGGNWKNLPIEKQKEYLGVSYSKGGGKTGIARRLSLNNPSLTILCSPMQKQTERCHPLEVRPLSIRESARIQTFPDEWVFCGSMSEQYKQIGNAVPALFSEQIGKTIVDYLNKMVD